MDNSIRINFDFDDLSPTPNDSLDGLNRLNVNGQQNSACPCPRDTVIKHPDRFGNDTTVTVRNLGSKTHISSHFPTSDDKVDAQCEQFRQYLDETGTLSKLVTTLETLFQANDSRNEDIENPRHYFLSIFGENVKPKTELKSLKAEINRLESNLDRVLDENAHIRSLLGIPEPTVPSSDDENDYEDDTLDEGEDEVHKQQETNQLLRIYEGLLEDEEHLLVSSPQQELMFGLGDVDIDKDGPQFESLFEQQHHDDDAFELEESENEFLGEEFEDGEDLDIDEFPAGQEDETGAEGDDELSDLLVLKDSDHELNYEAGNFVDHFSDSDLDKNNSEELLDDDGDYRFENESTQSECITDDSDIDSVCQKLEESDMDGDNYDEEFQDLMDDYDGLDDDVHSTHATTANAGPITRASTTHQE